MKCLDGSRMREQGRDEEHIRKVTLAKLKRKGCTSDAKNPVFRLIHGGKIYRCPRSTSDSSGGLQYFSIYSAIKDGLFTVSKKEVTWKWLSIMQTVRSELAVNNREEQRDIIRKRKSSSNK